MFHELSAYLSYQESERVLHYWRLPSGIEVDFVTEDLELAIEVKATARSSAEHLKGFRKPSVSPRNRGHIAAKRNCRARLRLPH